MTGIVTFAQNEQLTIDDLNAIGTLQRASDDNLIADAINNGLTYAGFPISQTSTTSITVGAGRIYQGGQQYSNEDNGGVAIPLINYLPVVAGNTKVVSIVGYCTDGPSVTVPRTFLTNAATGVTEADNVSTQDVRRANIAPSVGSEAPSPNPPVVSSSQCEIARIVLGQAGIVSIAYVTGNEVPNLTDVEARTAALEAFEAQSGSRINTLASDIANLAGQIVGLPSPTIFTQVVSQLAELGAQAKLPPAAINFHFDNFLSLANSASDTSNASFLATVQEGIRFPPAAQQLGILQLLNPLEPKIRSGTGTGIMLPDYAEAPRIDTTGNDGSIAIAQYQFQNISAVQKSLSRQVITFGPSQTVCQNSIWWQDGTYDPTTGIFSKNGEQYQVTLTGQYVDGYDRRHNLQLVRVAQIFTSTMTDTYTDYQTTTVTANGATLSQTFLNSQAGWLTSIDAYFTSVAATGDVTLLIVGTTNGAPDFGQVLSSTTVSAANLKTYPTATNFPLTATYLDAGSRYAIVLVTPGNHQVAYVANNKYAQGSLFYSTDGAWAQGDLTKDLAFRANFAKFTTTICQVQMSSTPFQLQNGITDISLLYGSKIPDGCQLVWEIQVNGLWYPLKSYATGAQSNPLLGLPPLVPVRVTYVGTTDLMPAIDMTQTQTLVSRPQGAFTHVTTPIAIGAPSSTIKVEVVVDGFYTAHHTVGCNLIVNGATVAPSTTSAPVADPKDPTRFTIDYVFSLGSATSTFAIKINGTTDVVTTVFHVESRFDYES